MIYNNIQSQIDSRLHLPESGAWPESWHRFDQSSVHAIIAAIAANKPLLVRGEPGVGKSQLACAAAVALNRRFIAQVVQPNTEYQELLWTFDHTQRLADAQLAGAMKDTSKIQDTEHYISPGALWWAYDWQSAEKMSTKQAFQPAENIDALDAIKSGVVLLIDEVDKADIALANGLLEVLGNGRFAVPPLGSTVSSNGINPLVVLTSNDTRQLPPALVRRCVVLDLALPKSAELLAHLESIGKTHFPETDDNVLRKAAEQIILDREQCRELPRTGQAEFLDLLSALWEISDDVEQQISWLDKLAPFFLKSGVER